MKFQIAVAQDQTGVFDIVIKLDKEHTENTRLKLEELLEKHYRQEEIIGLGLPVGGPQIAFSVDMAIYLLNKHILT